MKFAKYLQNNLVPEWRAKYLDYKKGKLLLKDIQRVRSRQLLSPSASTPRTPDRHEADSEDGHRSPGSTASGTVKRDKATIQQLSPLPKLSQEQSKNAKSGSSPPGSSPPRAHTPDRMTAASDDSVAPIVEQPSSSRERKPSIAAKIGQISQKNIRQVLDTLRRQTRRPTTESLEENSSTKDNDAEFNDSELYFLHWLDGEIKKIDDFYQAKEKEAEDRFKLLSEQLKMLRHIRETQLQNDPRASRNPSRAEPSDESHGFAPAWIGKPINHIRASLDGLSSAMPAADHERRARQPELMAHPFAHTMGYVEYSIARRRLREAVLEFYRGMELLKAYRLLNRTGISKILKKFDKISGRKQSREYTEKLKDMHFDHSNALDNIMTHTEDLYARYFEGNNRKNAVERLRSRDKPNEHIPAVFNTGFFLGLAVPFLLEGIVIARKPSTSETIPQTSFLLQVWGGIGIAILFLLLFGVNCWVWHDTKINYTFIFEFDPKHHLDYRQYFELPTFLAFVGCVCFWLTFKNFWPQQLYAVWYPLIFVCLCSVVLLSPFHTLHRSSRIWFAIANFRILFSGLYPIEFRDFFLGDQYNSLLYSFANVPLFFCLYAKNWRPTEIPMCSSGHSRVLGFFSTLPPIWRFFQCLRRYADTRNAFPHLLNAGKYSMTILMNMFLSLWRIDDHTIYKALFIVFASANTLYASWWDLFMDWSLMQPHAPHPFLRHDLGYKNIWTYYLAMIVDPLLRSSWLFYVVFPGQNQHSAATSFFLALGEVFRRFMWNFFRMENEHMTNVGHFLAARDVPLPFSLPSVSGPPGGPTLEAQPPLASSQSSLTMRTMGSIRRGMVRMTSSLRLRHAEDFARKPGPERGPQKGKLPDDGEISSDNDNGKQPIRDVHEHHDCEAGDNPVGSCSIQHLPD